MMIQILALTFGLLVGRVGARTTNSTFENENASTRLVSFNSAPFSSFDQLGFLPLPYNNKNKTWVFAVSCCNQSNFFSEDNVVNASHFYDILTPGFECAGVSDIVPTTSIGAVAEWGYEFHAFAASNPAFKSSPCVKLTMATLKENGITPQTKAQALTMMNVYFDCRTRVAQNGTNTKIFELIGHYYYGALGAQRGQTAVVATEIQENINSIQAHFALTRGAARQYNIPFAVDVSPWDVGYITDYSTSRFWGQASSAGGDGGHSLSLFKRSWYLSYLSGANHLIAEAGAVNLFYENKTSDGVMTLSPLGDLARGFAEFTRVVESEERPIPYVPFALVLEHAHGFGLSLVGGSAPTTWDTFPMTSSDQVAWSLMQTLWPGSWEIKSKGVGAESNYLVPSPYSDAFDIIAETNFTASLSGKYRVAITAGKITLGASQIAALRGWVCGGGTAVVFASQLVVNDSATAEFIGATLLATPPMYPTLAVVFDHETGWTHNRSNVGEENNNHNNNHNDHNNNHNTNKDNDNNNDNNNKNNNHNRDNDNNNNNNHNNHNNHNHNHNNDSGDATSAFVVQQPFCVAQNSNETAYYIKTGGDPSVKSGWGPPDRCCRINENSCLWFSSLFQCQIGLKKMTCVPCNGCTTQNIGCPTFSCNQPPTGLGLRSAEMTTATELIGGVSTQASHHPLVLKRALGQGFVITVLYEEASDLQDFGILSHLLSRMASDVLPFDVVDTNGNDMLATQLQLLSSRSSTGWQVTIVNNNGVTKQPAQAAIVNTSQALDTVLRMKVEYGEIASATMLTNKSVVVAVVNSSVNVHVGPGDLVVINLKLKS